jgi:hypothetical protein
MPSWPSVFSKMNFMSESPTGYEHFGQFPRKKLLGWELQVMVKEDLRSAIDWKLRRKSGETWPACSKRCPQSASALCVPSLGGRVHPISLGGLHSLIGIEFIAFVQETSSCTARHFDCAVQARLAENEAARIMRF